ncbi:Hypothetical predicted protein [Paramuricea clavata]|uniref:Uncharacterized protein n=1 Tax=Paramuricea clavata TaxID=317549 RepID=A0A6S7FQ47_PARCT|nr:Hypothetical predicted protein [Paramuricea clavata]
MAIRFGRNPTEICLIFNEVLDLVYDAHHHRLESWNQPFLSPELLQNCADAVHDKGAPLENCFGFIDAGTVRPIARPKYYQRQMYNGHKRVHSIKFQSVVLPNGLIANLAGPYEGKRHDSTMLRVSGLLASLRQVAFHNNQPLCLYVIQLTHWEFICKHRLEIGSLHLKSASKITQIRPVLDLKVDSLPGNNVCKACFLKI